MSTLQACLNGDRPVGAHPALPVTTQQLVNDTVAVVELGVTAVHLHPRNAAGAETLAAAEVATTVAAVRSVARGVEIGVTTGAWIEPDPARRAEFVAGWAGAAAGHPDVASVNVHEPGWRAVCAALADAGVGIELGVSDLAAASQLRAAGLPAGTVRVLAEVRPAEPEPALAEADRLVDALSWVDAVPVLLHGQDGGAWPVLAMAVERGLPTRIGLEDVLHTPDGNPAADNPALVRAAITLASRTTR
ncbi:3-keto-5-aminohexanoate cleavage protein [Goodfellowiella coeruleoviolacea]|uniref:3-keto-5-aminohexanoate cleavage protein n=1 Tax=Goodfellowiella coeruleoviolacea TaxID=334858 RepID=UPI0020A4F55D|nr:3-keto-5-aminohexanoate cleavage protein [Goodfellowiella coeruleoviolacea]